MSDALIGIIVGVTVALAAQVISYFFDRRTDRQEKRQQREAVLSLLYHEVDNHRGNYQHLLSWAQESIDKGGPEHTGYSYEKIRNDAYEKVFLVHWSLLPDEVIDPVMEYYGVVNTVNQLSSDFAVPTPVPIKEAKEFMERAQNKADDLIGLLAEYIPPSKTSASALASAR